MLSLYPFVSTKKLYFTFYMLMYFVFLCEVQSQIEKQSFKCLTLSKYKNTKFLCNYVMIMVWGTGSDNILTLHLIQSLCCPGLFLSFSPPAPGVARWPSRWPHSPCRRTGHWSTPCPHSHCSPDSPCGNADTWLLEQM